MKNKANSQYKPKLLITGITLGAFIAAARPMAVPKVNAATNLYDWTKQEDLDVLGGYYTSAASSADGSHLILSVTEGGENTDQISPLFVSSNSGSSWENVAGTIDADIRHYWSSTDVSNDGQVMVAASDSARSTDNVDDYSGKIVISEDGGDTWEDITVEAQGDWRDVVVSGDGSTIAAVQNGWGDGNVYISVDRGETWTTSRFAEDAFSAKSVSVSDDGDTILVGGENNDPYTNLHISKNGGDTWEDISPDPEDEIYELHHDISADGNKIVATTNGWVGGQNDSVFVSSNEGADWTDVTPDDDTTADWNDVAISDDGTSLSLLDSQSDKMYLSGDTGANWSEEDPQEGYDDTSDFVMADNNSDGSKIIVASRDNAYLNHNTAPAGTSTVTLDDAEGGKKIVVTTPDGTIITCSSAVKESNLNAQDTAYQYPLGFIDFCFSGAETANEISIIFVTDLKPNEVAVRKYNPDNQSYATITEANVSQTTYQGDSALLVTYIIVDNGPLDTNPDTGEVADPVGLGTLEVSSPETGKQKHWLLSVK